MTRKKFGLIGHPLGHSLSPLIHRRIMEIAGIDGDYSMYDAPAEDLPRLVPELVQKLDGFNCTIPHKTAIIPYMESLDKSAAICGAVNTVYKGRGYNTDIDGFLSAGIELHSRKVLLLGAGGSAHMMAALCVKAGARSLEINARNQSKADALAAHLAATFPGAATNVATSTGSMESGAYGVILNATPLGMWPNGGGIPCNPVLLQPGVTVFDPVYNPTPSRFVLNARKNGARATGGLRMLLRQAIAAQRLWNPGVYFDEHEIETAVLPEMLRELFKSFPVKFLVTGFMGSGKTTVSKLLAARLGISFFDLDQEIEKTAGKTVREIFAESGEEGFRELESAVAESTLRHPESAVVAAGGGLPCQPENRKLIRSTNTLVLNIHAPFATLWERIAGDASRPLAANQAAAEELYKRRVPIYAEFCDCNFSAEACPDDVAEAIEKTITDMGTTK